MTRGLSEADRALSELAGLARTLPNPHLLIGPFIRREAVLSSRIEGTRTALSDLFFFEAADAAPPHENSPPLHDVKEVFNYVKALEYGLRRLDELPLCLRLIREMHAILMEGVRGEHSTPGEFRKTQNWIGPAGCVLMDATFVPPPVPDLGPALDQLEKYLHADKAFPPLLWIAMVHYQFEAIHPFPDGNGRIGRLLISLLLGHESLLSAPLLYLSAFFEKNRDEYYQRLISVSRNGDWPGWLQFFLEGVATQARDAVWRSGALLGLWREHRRRFQSARSSALLLQLIDRLFAALFITVPQAARILEITPRSAGKHIERLVGEGILVETTGRERYRVYAAPEILKVIEGTKDE
ncbi:MAG: Fic family protein [Thermodesulfobacteriota bacterium]